LVTIDPIKGYRGAIESDALFLQSGWNKEPKGFIVSTLNQNQEGIATSKHKLVSFTVFYEIFSFRKIIF